MMVSLNKVHCIQKLYEIFALVCDESETLPSNIIETYLLMRLDKEVIACAVKIDNARSPGDLQVACRCSDSRRSDIACQTTGLQLSEM